MGCSPPTCAFDTRKTYLMFHGWTTFQKLMTALLHMRVSNLSNISYSMHSMYMSDNFEQLTFFLVLALVFFKVVTSASASWVSSSV